MEIDESALRAIAIQLVKECVKDICRDPPKRGPEESTDCYKRRFNRYDVNRRTAARFLTGQNDMGELFLDLLGIRPLTHAGIARIKRMRIRDIDPHCRK